MEKQWHAREQNNLGRRKPPISTVLKKCDEKADVGMVKWSI